MLLTTKKMGSTLPPPKRVPQKPNTRIIQLFNPFQCGIQTRDSLFHLWSLYFMSNYLGIFWVNMSQYVHSEQLIWHFLRKLSLMSLSKTSVNAHNLVQFFVHWKILRKYEGVAILRRNFWEISGPDQPNPKVAASMQNVSKALLSAQLNWCWLQSLICTVWHVSLSINNYELFFLKLKESYSV